MREQYENILIVTPRYQSKDMLGTLVRKSDGTVLVASTGKSSKKEMYQLIKSVAQTGTELLGYIAVKR